MRLPAGQEGTEECAVMDQTKDWPQLQETDVASFFTQAVSKMQGWSHLSALRQEVRYYAASQGSK